MIIIREQALTAIDRGDATFDGCTNPEEFGPHHNGCWIVTNTAEQRTDHVPIDGSEPLTGCISCGFIVDPEPDQRGCGCHCPNCGATL